MTKIIKVQYYALLREERGESHETIPTNAKTARELYDELQRKHGFRLNTDLLKVAVNGAFCDWHRELKTKDTVVFIPPVAGG